MVLVNLNIIHRLFFTGVVVYKLSTLATSLHQGDFSFPECGNTYTSSNGTISSPITFSNSSVELYCKWIIDTRNKSTLHHLKLRLVDFNVNGAMPYCTTGDYVEIFIGCEYISIGRFCGVSGLPVFYSTDGCMGITLYSKRGRSNLKAKYGLRPLNKEVQRLSTNKTAGKNCTAVQGGCGLSQLDNTRHGNIYSPLWPLPYPDYVDCVWTVRARKDLEVKLIFFDFDVKFHKPCEHIDFIEVRAGSTGYVHARTLTKDKECGQKKPFSMIISTDTFYITFRSDKGRGPRGFMAGFVAYEKGTTGFDPQVLIVFGCGLLLAILISFKKKLFPTLVRAHKRLLGSGAQRNLKFWRQPPCDCAYNCACQKKVSMRKRISLKRLRDSTEQGTMASPIAPKECFVEQNDCWDQPTLVSLQGMTGSFTTKSASDLGCAHFNEASLFVPSNLQPNSEDTRSLSCKLVRFANPDLSNQLFPSQ